MFYLNLLRSDRLGSLITTQTARSMVNCFTAFQFTVIKQTIPYIGCAVYCAFKTESVYKYMT